MNLAKHMQALTLIVLFLLTACTHPISEQTRKEVDPQTTFARLQGEPDAFIDKKLLLGGVIVSVEKDDKETLLEIMQWGLNRLGEPTSLINEKHLFLVRSEEPLDPATFEPGVLVTLAGVVLGQETRLIGDNEHVYPVIASKEIYPWKSPYRYGIHRYPGPDYPHYVGGDNANRNPYDPGYSVYPYTQHWYRVAR